MASLESLESSQLTALQRALALCELCRWDEAVSHLRTVLATDPHNEVGLCLMATAQYEQAAYDESLRTSLTAISENPEDEWPHRLASLALFSLGRHAEARVMARDVVRLAPNVADGHVNLAFILAESEPDPTKMVAWRQADRGEARAAAERAVFLAPNEASSHIAVGGVAGADPALQKEAEAALHRALALEPDNSRAHQDLAQLHLRSGRKGNTGALAQAASEFASAIRANPGSSASRSNFDLCLHKLLVHTTYVMSFVAFVALLVSSSNGGVLARALAASLLALPALTVGRFVYVLAPQLRGRLISVLRRPLNAGAVLCDALAAKGVVVAAISQSLSPNACWGALAFAVLARVILLTQNRS